jgi:hypothetical protein
MDNEPGGCEGTFLQWNIDHHIRRLHFIETLLLPRLQFVHLEREVGVGQTARDELLLPVQQRGDHSHGAPAEKSLKCRHPSLVNLLYSWTTEDCGRSRARNMSEALFRVRKLSRSNGRDQMIRDFLLEIFCTHEQFTTGELSQSGGRQKYLYKMYIQAHAEYNISSCKVIH